MISLAGALPDELRRLINFPRKYQAVQVFQAIKNGVSDINEISALPKLLRNELAQKYTVFSGAVEKTLTDPDGTKKIAVRFDERTLVEAVALTDLSGRKTACLSTQAGCAMGCVFCRTGKDGLLRNLNEKEIIEQFLLLERDGTGISNIVFMGMGEPLQNLEATRKSIDYFTNSDGPGISFRKITISTCGVLEGLKDLLENGPAVKLAVSLNSADREIRKRLMPFAAKTSLEDLRTELLAYQKKGGRRITFEYVAIKGINDGPADIASLKKFCSGLNCYINLIPLNPGGAEGLRAPSERDLKKFLNAIASAGLNAGRRYRRGSGIDGACGQLAYARDKKSKNYQA